MNEAKVNRLNDRLSIPALLERYPRRRGRAVLRSILGDGASLRRVTVNEFEDAFVALLEASGLPRPRFNADLSIRGRFIRPDAVWREAKLIAELDGRATHGTEQAFESDRHRDRQLLVEGWRVTRITWRQLRDEPAEVVADLRTLLSGGAASTV
jgi:very-short-patch-repair endonuclease